MKTTRSVRGAGKTAHEDGKHYFAITPILINLIAVAVLIAAYCYIISAHILPAYQNYIYWAVNILVSYNILAASARSLIAPILSIIVGSLGIFANSSTTSIAFLSALTSAQCWQLAILGIVGLLITFALRL
jgi:hypothetical protein